MTDILSELTRPLTAEDVEFRVNTTAESGLQLLIYKTARTDVKRLNEVFGLHWKSRHYHDAKGSLVCEISIYDKETNLWISREDVGTESNTEKEKGEYSDSFKRAGFKWGIGMELYNAPFIWIKWEMKQRQKDGKAELNKYKKPIWQEEKRFDVKKIIVKEYLVENGDLKLTLELDGKIIFSNTGKKVDAVKTEAKPKAETKPVEKITTTTGTWEKAGFTSLAQARHSFDKAKASVEAITNIDTILEKETDIKKFIAKVKIWDLQIAQDLQDTFDKKRNELEGNIPDNTADLNDKIPY